MRRWYVASEPICFDSVAMTPKRNWTMIWSIMIALWSATLLYLSLTPATPHMMGLFGWDKLQHAAALGVLALLVSCACMSLRKSLPKVSVVGFFSATLFGALIELLQGWFTVSRQADVFDIAADAVGAFIAVLFLFLYVKTRGEY
jgi:VanZ family protein